MLFMIMPTIAVTIAPDTPPPTSWPSQRADIHAARRAVKHRDQRGQERSAGDAADRARRWCCRPVPRLMFFAAAPTALPPIAPAMSWMMRLMIVP